MIKKLLMVLVMCGLGVGVFFGLKLLQKSQDLRRSASGKIISVDFYTLPDDLSSISVNDVLQVDTIGTVPSGEIGIGMMVVRFKYDATKLSLVNGVDDVKLNSGFSDIGTVVDDDKGTVEILVFVPASREQITTIGVGNPLVSFNFKVVALGEASLGLDESFGDMKIVGVDGGTTVEYQLRKIDGEALSEIFDLGGGAVDPVNGGWSDCSLVGTSCKKTCTNPVPSGGGADCAGSNVCAMSDCTDDLGEWGEWSLCTVSCGGGAETRTCKDGKYCLKEDGVSIGLSETKTGCNSQACTVSVDGGWSDCSLVGTSCEKTCTNPVPSGGGASCAGSNVCAMSDCTGDLGEWGEWGSCTVSCGGGAETRTCKDGKYCLKEDGVSIGLSETKTGCNSQVCGDECLRAGEAKNSSLGPGDPNHDKNCCQGLELLAPLRKYNEDCSTKVDFVGFASTCSDCGNNVCESWENKCSCPDDCGDKVASLSFDIAFSGVRASSKCAGHSVKVNVVVLRGEERKEYVDVLAVATTEVNARNEIVYRVSNLSLADFSQTSGLAVFVKGSKHLQVKYGIDGQTELYNLAGGQLNVEPAKVFDFSEYSLMAGDVNRDGQVDSLDFVEVKKRAATFETIEEGTESQYDLDGSCMVNSIDVALLVQSLNEKYDQIY